MADEGVAELRLLRAAEPSAVAVAELRRQVVRLRAAEPGGKAQQVVVAQSQRWTKVGGRGGGAAALTYRLLQTHSMERPRQYGVQAGKPDFGGLAKGVWNVPYIVNMATQGRAENGCPVVVPFKPAALTLWEDRELRNKEAGDPESFCLPPGIPRMMYTPYPAQIYQMPDRIVMVFEGGAHVWRLIWMDGRPLPKVDDINPDYLGYSVGHWEGDTLVVNSLGFNHQTWLDATGHPHGEQLKVTEK